MFILGLFMHFIRNSKTEVILFYCIPMILCLTVTRLLPAGYLRQDIKNHDGKMSHILKKKRGLLEAYGSLKRAKELQQLNSCFSGSPVQKQSASEGDRKVG